MEPNNLYIHESSTVTKYQWLYQFTAQADWLRLRLNTTDEHQRRPLRRVIFFLSGQGKGGGTVHVGVGVESVDLGDERDLGDVLGEVDVDGADADLGAGLALHVDVRLRVLPAPHDHHRQPWHLRATHIVTPQGPGDLRRTHPRPGRGGARWHGRKRLPGCGQK
jgi:hypothetical protein